MERIYYNGDIITMEREDDRPEAILISDGRIRALGGFRELCSLASGAELYDLEGKTLLPGFIDSHSHITQLASTLQLVSLSDCRSRREVAQKLIDYKEQARPKPGEWIVGFGYDNNSFADKRHPEKQDLDRVSPDNPVLISHVSGHMGVINTKGLMCMGIDSQTPDPEGGRIGRMDGGREPNGFLEENAFIRISGNLPAPPMAERLALLDKAQDIYLSYGITTAQDGKSTPDELELLSKAAGVNRLKMDIVSYVDFFAAREYLNREPQFLQKYQNHYKVGGYKIFLDGSPQGRTAWMTEPYQDAEDGYRGYPVHTEEEVSEAVRVSREKRVQLLAHCNGDAAAGQYIAAYAKEPSKDGRPVIIHAQLLRRDQLDEVKRLGMIPSFFVAHTYFWGDAHLQNFGWERAGYISPLHSAVEREITFTLHQDTPVLPPDMLFTLWCAVNRVTKGGKELAKSERITPYEALKGVTINAAYQYFEEKEKGTLATGKLADMVILSHNPMKVKGDAIREIRVVETIKEGRTLYKCPESR